ncbi:MAG: restriction endonuclease [Candidatus Doudnabacteria bacterium RIFCSPHIGHO2_12_FULL_48_11]|uniref:Restriction endonuclease n=1 Tax=Candidatus Doudnabacteria bacterium RIFCSPHIGHO2_01_FULL_46_24 TaxID=1817825 RepID=A0A1F5NTG8_9BACT|nr:MAG: restriction endonuclease [Candidatus Doudnabacteria bacterium RIFCSPHIGHO2_01_FULL_46_24]OGE96021.1 MAG: restriction endonuclease [Candidatus Doudnabacteria bacterium RIFCSPHIGHO2_12_FULL_48_11]
MRKAYLTEQDISTKFIIPAVTTAGWDLQTQIREQYYFTAGRIIVHGKTVKRGEGKRVDVILYYKNDLPLALIETKDPDHSVGDGMQQGLAYAEALDIPFVYSSNGKAFLEHDRTITKGKIENEISLESFPSPTELYERYKKAKNINERIGQIIDQDYYQEVGGKEPRYFQRVAINRAVEAVAKGQKRLLLVMATGTGKTYTAFQIIWRLWKSKTKKRILFLVDRNILANQTRNNDFVPFGDKMVKIEHRNVDKAYEIYLALYQGLTGTEEENNIFKQFSPDFFDLVIVDECHRGSAKDNSAWREILDYYKSATQIGLTATPKETKDISTQSYFGESIYTYSLKQGIEDGFLAPYKVIRLTLDRDVEGYRPEIGKTDKYGNEVPDRIYNAKDYDRNLVIDERTQLVASKISEYLKSTNPYQKTIVFCVDIDHAERMRQALVNQNSELVAENRRYVVRITGDNDEGKKELDNFIDPESVYPVIAVTSKLMTTGVDAQTCELIVLDTNINSVSEFKQIIGRGTRIREDYHKFYFTILDFRNATELFSDPDFDGDPVVVYEPKGDDPIDPPPGTDGPPDDTGTTEGSGSDIIIIDGPGGNLKKYYVNNVAVKIINERVQYMDENGKLITESLKDYSKKNILSEHKSLDDFLKAWTNAEKKEAIINELESRGVIFEELEKEIGKDLDPFDLVCHLAFGKPPLTRKERADNVKKRNYFAKYEGKAREVIDALIEKYADAGITAIDSIDDLQVSPFPKFGTPYEIVNIIFGGREKYLSAIKEIETSIYKV